MLVEEHPTAALPGVESAARSNLTKSPGRESIEGRTDTIRPAPTAKISGPVFSGTSIPECPNDARS